MFKKTLFSASFRVFLAVALLALSFLCPFLFEFSGFAFLFTYFCCCFVVSFQTSSFYVVVVASCCLGLLLP